MKILLFCSNPFNGGTAKMFYELYVAMEKKLTPQGHEVIAAVNEKNPVDIYELRDIREVRTGKYAGLMGTLILELKNGKAVSFVPASKKAGAAGMCELIRQYL